MSVSSEMISSDFLIIGSGVAGLSYALKVAEHGKVIIVTKKEDVESNTNYAQGGIAAVLAKNDSLESHIEDTLNAGAGICDKKAVDILVNEGPVRVKELVDFGAEFTRNEAGSWHLGREGGHSFNRIIHSKDLTGREVERALLKRAHEHPNITFYEDHIAIDLITEHQTSPGLKTSRARINCFGAYALDIPGDKIKIFPAKITMLSTGGMGKVYLHTTNPSIATGDGVAMTYRAGGKLANLEFMQFHPTTLYHPEGNSFLISEAVRGAGAKLITIANEEFMYKYDERGALAPRDIVARAIDRELKLSGENFVYLDISHVKSEKVMKHFPNIYKKCKELNINITKEPIPVVPAAHYMCGGIVSDLYGRTSIKNLFVCGEASCTGVHGANRLASNSLLEALVFAKRAADKSIEKQASIDNVNTNIPLWDDTGTFNNEEWVLIAHDRKEIQQLMSDYVGIVRSNFRLTRAMNRIKMLSREVEDYYRRTKVSEKLIELRNLATNAYLIVKCALTRKESRGLHYNTDYPEKDDRRWKKDTIHRTK